MRLPQKLDPFFKILKNLMLFFFLLHPQIRQVEEELSDSINLTVVKIIEGSVIDNAIISYN